MPPQGDKVDDQLLVPMTNIYGGSPNDTASAGNQQASGSVRPLLDGNNAQQQQQQKQSAGALLPLVQFAASVARQIKQKLRKPVGCALEMLLPIAFVLLMAMLATLSSDETKPAQLFLFDPAISSGPKDFSARLAEIACVRAPVVKPITVDLNTSTTAEILRFYYLPACTNAPPAGEETADGSPLKCGGEWLGQISDDLCYERSVAPAIESFYGDFQNATTLPHFDVIYVAHYVFIDAVGRPDYNFPRASRRNAARVYGQLYFTPDTPATHTFVGHLAGRPGMRLLWQTTLGGYLANDGYAREYVRSEAGAGKAYALVNLDESVPDALTASIGFNLSAVPWTNRAQSRFSNGAGDELPLFFASGFLSLERDVLATVNDLNGGNAADPFSQAGDEAAVLPMPFPSFKDNIFLQIAGFLTPLALVLSYLSGVSQVAERLVLEKELRLREAMAAMGVGKTTLYVSWLTTFFLQNLGTAIGMTIALKTTFITGSAPTLIFVVVLLFTLSTTTLGSLISTFFGKSRTAAIATPILFFAVSIPSFALPDETARSTLLALSFLSPTAFATAFKLIIEYELNNGIGWNDFANPNDEIAIGTSIFFLLLDTVLYALLAWYIDNVLGGEWGVRRHPCFCFQACFCPPKSKYETAGQEYHANVGPQTTSGQSEVYPTGTNPAVVIAEAAKEFGSGDELKKAVDNVSLKVFPGMVTAVLGHNGAGKTTLFNMLTGMLPMSGGDCFIYGSSITADTSNARKNIGMCPQHNILWNDLTCYEHLEYFARVKGMPLSECGPAAEAMLKAVDLADKRDAKSASLSGGQKRKLSVGIAFIGGSQLVLLDEPTAGMDVHTRRATWELIQKMSREEGRAVILTTHFMDEAELLGDRVGIMSAGKLHSYGSTTFLKSRLGEGYTLSVQYQTPPDERSRAEVLRIVQGFVDTASEKECRGREQHIVLPMNRVAAFAEMLRRLESDGTKREHSIATVSMTVATIEDVFVSIAEESGGVAHATVSPNAGVAASVLANTPEGAPTGMKQFVGLMKKRFHNARRDRRALALQLVLPILSILLAMALAESGPPTSGPQLINADILEDPQEGILGGCSNEFRDGVNEFLKTIPATNGTNAYRTAEFLLANADHHGDIGRTVAIQCLDQTNAVNGTPTTMLWSNSTALRPAAPFSVYTWYQGRINSGRLASGLTSKYEVSLFTAPLPFTVREKERINGIAFALMAIFVTIPFSFVPSTYTGFIVKERASKAKLLQFVSGVGYFVYWASNFLFDLVCFSTTMVLAFIIFAAFNREEYVGSGAAFGTTFLLILMYGLASIPMSYVMSLAFTNHSSAQNVVLGVFFIAGFGLTLAGYLLQLLDGPVWLRFLFRFFPPAALGEGLIALANAPGKEQTGEDVDLLALDETGWALVYLGITSVITTAAILFVDHPERTKRQQMLSYEAHKFAPVIEGEPADVAKERRDAEAAKGDAAFLRVVGLRKEFSSPNGGLLAKNVAVQNLTFHVPKGEIFGLLGTNGAGKTTTMNVITGECLPSTGHAWVDGHDVVEQAGEARKVIGYCPQFDALHDLMTVEEHLDLYIALRGIPDAQGSLKDALITAMGLGEYRRVKSKGLSGGNKRKLSVAISLVGAPRLLLLDEPTAGMDPVARRGLCDVVAAVSKHCAVVLTTHHLEEVEALADRAAIMVAGKMQCLGTLEHLKATLGEGYSVSVRIGSEAAAEAVGTRLTREFPGGGVQLVEQHQTRLRFTVKQNQNTSLSSLFELLYQLKTAARGSADGQLGVLDYTVAQSSVEEVFLAVAGGHTPQPLTGGISLDNNTPRLGPSDPASFL